MNLQTRSTEEFNAQNYTSITGHQQVFGRSVIKGYFHNRQATGSVEDDANYNRIAGAELNYRSDNGQWRATGGYGKSWTPDLKDDNYYYNTILSYNSRTVAFIPTWQASETIIALTWDSCQDSIILMLSEIRLLNWAFITGLRDLIIDLYHRTTR